MQFSQDKIQTINIDDRAYPSEWKTLSDAPQILQYVGDITLFNSRKLTVVGSRRTPISSLKTGAEIVKGIASAFTIVTGTADGGDSTAIESALSVGGKVICVLAGGFSAIPQTNLPLLKRVVQHGLIISPHPYDTPVMSFSYEYRNKLLALLGEGTLVLGAAEKSGALITAKYAQKYDKSIFALPYSVGVLAGVGCNALIKQGGYLTETATDILEKFGIDKTPQKREIALSADEQKLLDALQTLSTAHITALAAHAGLPIFKARALLSAREVKGLCVSVGGNQYSPV